MPPTKNADAIQRRKERNKTTARKSRTIQKELICSLEQECIALYQKCIPLIPKNNIPSIPELEVFSIIRTRTPYYSKDRITEKKKRNSTASQSLRNRKKKYIKEMVETVKKYKVLLEAAPKPSSEITPEAVEEDTGLLDDAALDIILETIKKDKTPLDTTPKSSLEIISSEELEALFRQNPPFITRPLTLEEIQRLLCSPVKERSLACSPTHFI